MTTRLSLLYPTPIANLVPQRPAMVHGVVVRVGGIIERFSQGKARPLRTVLLRDATGQVPLALWGDEVGHVREADRLLLVEAWVGEFRGRPELTLSSRGYLINLGPANGRGPIWRPRPRDRLLAWGLVRRRLREKGLRASRPAASAAPGAKPMALPPIPTPSTSPSGMEASEGAP